MAVEGPADFIVLSFFATSDYRRRGKFFSSLRFFASSLLHFFTSSLHQYLLRRRIDYDRTVHVDRELYFFAGLGHIVRLQLGDGLSPAEPEGGIRPRAGRLDELNGHFLRHHARARTACAGAAHVLRAHP